jgi:hypothetical protein
MSMAPAAMAVVIAMPMRANADTNAADMNADANASRSRGCAKQRQCNERSHKSFHRGNILLVSECLTVRPSRNAGTESVMPASVPAYHDKMQGAGESSPAAQG